MRPQGRPDGGGWRSLPDTHVLASASAAWGGVQQLASLRTVISAHHVCTAPTCRYQIRAPFVSASVPASLMAPYSLSPLLLWAELGCRFSRPPITDLSMRTGALLLLLLLLLLLPYPLHWFGATVCWLQPLRSVG